MADFTDPRDPDALGWTDFERDLVALGRSRRTIQSYRETCQQLADHAKGADLLSLTRADIQDYLLEVRTLRSGTRRRASAEGKATSTEQVHLRSLHRFYAWAEAEELVARSPMTGMSLPKAEEKVIDVPENDDLRKLLAACAIDPATKLPYAPRGTTSTP